ncbi:MAG: alpha-1,2-fucosyltransferase [Bacteroidia bacterium]
MILVRVQGGLGNQMFQYAFGKMLSKKNHTVLKIDTSLLRENMNQKNVVVRNFDLDIFNVTKEFATDKEIVHFNGYPKGTLLQRTWFKIAKSVIPRNLLIQDKHIFNPAHLNAPDNTCIVGRWQSELYFKDALKDVLHDFEIKKEWLLNTVFKEQILKSKNPVSVHVRREDYVVDENNNVIRSGLVNGNLGIEYYKETVKYIQSKIEGPTFFVFSEDMEWCQANLGFIPNAIFVKTEKNKKGMAEDMYLIGLCKHHITSHSTFSWWGAYLSKHADKTVIAPKQWSNTSDEFTPPYIIPDNWITL